MGKELIKRQNFVLFFFSHIFFYSFVRMYIRPLFSYAMFDRLESEILRLAKKISKCAITESCLPENGLENSERGGLKTCHAAI